MPRRSRKKVPSARMQKALSAHAKFLAAHGIDASKPPRPTGGPTLSLYVSPSAPTGALPDTSDTIPGNGTKQDRQRDNGGRVIGQAYHKGPLQVLSSKDDLKRNKRRDPL
jgi:hypothetical protein